MRTGARRQAGDGPPEQVQVAREVAAGEEHAVAVAGHGVQEPLGVGHVAQRRPPDEHAVAAGLWAAHGRDHTDLVEARRAALRVGQGVHQGEPLPVLGAEHAGVAFALPAADRAVGLGRGAVQETEVLPQAEHPGDQPVAVAGLAPEQPAQRGALRQVGASRGEHRRQVAAHEGLGVRRLVEEVHQEAVSGAAEAREHRGAPPGVDVVPKPVEGVEVAQQERQVAGVRFRREPVAHGPAGQAVDLVLEAPAQPRQVKRLQRAGGDRRGQRACRGRGGYARRRCAAGWGGGRHPANGSRKAPGRKPTPSAPRGERRLGRVSQNPGVSAVVTSASARVATATTPLQCGGLAPAGRRVIRPSSGAETSPRSRKASITMSEMSRPVATLPSRALSSA